MPQIGSTIDVNSVVAELMKVQRIKYQRMQQAEAIQQNQKDIYSNIGTQVEELKKKIEALKNSFNTVAYNISSDNEEIATAKITSNTSIAEMDHVLRVEQLARSEVVGSNTLQTSKTDALSMSGTLTFTVNGEDFNVDVSSVDSLSKIRDRINEAADNVGVSASIVASTDGGEDRYSLVIASRDTGIQSKVTISGDLAASFDFTNTISAAQDAKFTLDGASVERSSNSIDDVIDGITFNLVGADNSKAVNLKVTRFNDDIHSGVTTALQDMVSQYNSLINYIDRAIGNHAITDSTAKLVKMKVRDLVSGSYGEGGINHLLDLGIKLKQPEELPTQDGKTYVSIGGIELDEEKFTELLSAQFGDVEDMLINGANSYNDVAIAALDDLLKVGGSIPEKTKAIDEEISRINKEMDRELNRLDQVQEELTMKYTSLNTILDKYNNISGFLDQQLSMLSTTRKK